MKDIKFRPIPFVSALIVAVLLLGFLHTLSAIKVRAQEVATEPHIDSSKLFITESRANAFILVNPTYSRVNIGNWLTIQGEEISWGQTITVPDVGPFSPEHSKVLSNHEPSVVKKENGTWEITFKEVKP